MDPYARSIIHDANGNLNGLIATSDEAYATPGYSTPPWNELVIYEMHVRTFLYGGGYDGSGSFSSAITKLDYLRDLGINAIDNPAQFLGRLRDLGTVEAGKIADLALLDANPLDDIHNTRKINSVVLAGRFFSRKELDEMLERVQAAAATSR
jgi:glycosidase